MFHQLFPPPPKSETLTLFDIITRSSSAKLHICILLDQEIHFQVQVEESES